MRLKPRCILPMLSRMSRVFFFFFFFFFGGGGGGYFSCFFFVFFLGGGKVYGNAIHVIVLIAY